MKINLIISDITCMKEKFCIGGFDYFNNRMIRLMPKGKHWEENDLEQLKGFSTISADGEFPPKDKARDFPHKTEDFHINPESIKILQTYKKTEQLAKDLQNSTSLTIQDIFSKQIKEKYYVPAKTKCRSLGGIKVPSENVNFYKDENSKLRVWIKDNDRAEYNIKVSSKFIRDLWEQENKNANKLNELLLKSNKKVHVRIGLASAFSLKKNRCYLMCNGLFLM